MRLSSMTLFIFRRVIFKLIITEIVTDVIRTREHKETVLKGKQNEFLFHKAARVNPGLGWIGERPVEFHTRIF